MGVLMLGTPSGGITPEFAQVLRAQILGKDTRWFRIEVSSAANGAPPTVVRVEPGAADE
jgi:hypothetical protein